jgi:hypothetical protein
LEQHLTTHRYKISNPILSTIKLKSLLHLSTL